MVTSVWSKAITTSCSDLRGAFASHKNAALLPSPEENGSYGLQSHLTQPQPATCVASDKRPAASRLTFCQIRSNQAPAAQPPDGIV